MANHLFNLFLILIITTSTITITALAASYPKPLLLTVTKDSTSQYTTKILQRTPAVPITLTLDLANLFLWVVCGNGYKSSTYNLVPCGSAQCKLASANHCKTCTKKGCNTCSTMSITNPITQKSPPSGGEFATDVVKLNSTNGSTTGKLVTIPNFLFTCAPKTLTQGLAKGVTGIAGLGRSKFSVASPIFALCMPRSFSGFGTPENGAVFLGDGPYNYSPAGTGTVVDVRSLLKYTPLVTNPVFPNEYFIGVQAIKVQEKDIPINKALLSLSKNGHGGTTISLAQSYTVLETSIFKAVTKVFDEQLNKPTPNSKRVTPVAPFQICYDTVPGSRVGPAVPSIQFVLSNKVAWYIDGTNSIVTAAGSYCLAFVDGGKNPRTSIVIGGYQIENNLLQFDMPKNRLGFSSTLVPERILCNSFNFTSNN